MKIAICAAEMAPYAKTGGLADVVGSLPQALGRIGHRVKVLIPRFRGILDKTIKITSRVEVIFVENKKYFDRPYIYGRPGKDYDDNLSRFSFFNHEVLNYLEKTGFCPDILHSHDWHTGPINLMLRERREENGFFCNTRAVFTIHNLAYQGLFSADKLRNIGIRDTEFNQDALEFYGKMSFLKAGIEGADWVTTVSPAYSREIQTKENGCGLHKSLRRRKSSLSGILNGIDTKIWNPNKDKAVPNRYNRSSLSGRLRNKLSLQKEANLAQNPNIPIIGMVTRLAEQKGFDLLIDVFEQILKQGFQWVLLGEGDAKYEKFFKKINAKFKGKAKNYLTFSGQKASLIYAGSDFFLMPSRFEPCGLGQMISFRYGTIPIVRQTGGLADSVTDVDARGDGGRGLVFKQYSKKALLRACNRARDLYKHKDKILGIVKKNMSLDLSWNSSAVRYSELFEKVRS